MPKVPLRKQSPAPRTSSAESQHRALPEVSVNPQIQSAVQPIPDQIPYLHEPMPLDTHTNHHHIQVEPTNTLKRTTSPIKPQQIIDVQPNIIVQHPRTISRPITASHVLQTATSPPPPPPTTTPVPIKDPLNEAYIERDNNNRLQNHHVENTQTNNDNDSTSTLKQYENQREKMKNQPSSPPPSPSSKELTRAWKKQRNRYSIRAATAALVTRKNSAKGQRPPARLKNYNDDSDSSTTATETQSKEDGRKGKRKHFDIKLSKLFRYDSS